jgi:peptidoglycan hydrolase CwlO-like protein
MAGPVAALTWAQLGVALLVIVGAGYGVFRTALASAEKGYIYRYIFEPQEKAKNAHEQVDDVEKKVDQLDNKIEDIAEHQELQTDALIAVGESMNNGHDFDVEAFQSRANDRSVDRFLKGDDD